jgi:endonuclease/exonuclease/phosphatase family metal-dependent hydrolase
MIFAALSWNLLHGRDYPRDPELRTSWRYRLWPGEWRRGDDIQVNRSLLGEFQRKIASFDWDVAMLQEVRPSWLRPLASASRASGASVRTSRNTLAFLRTALADWNPDLIQSNDGGSNHLLVRPPWRIERVERMELARHPERRTAIWARLRHGEDGRTLCAANMHLTAEGDHSRSAHELLRVAAQCVEWDADSPLVVGGDMNLRPREQPWAFEELQSKYGLAPRTADDAIDHLLGRGLEVVVHPRRLPTEAREVVRDDGGRVRLSDHAPVEARFKVP